MYSGTAFLKLMQFHRNFNFPNKLSEYHKVAFLVNYFLRLLRIILIDGNAWCRFLIKARSRWRGKSDKNFSNKVLKPPETTSIFNEKLHVPPLIGGGGKSSKNSSCLKNRMALFHFFFRGSFFSPPCNSRPC